MSTQDKKAKVWSEENTALVVAAYKEKLEAEGAAAAADNDFLTSLAKKIGAPSDKSVRGKLAILGVYVKPEVTASLPKGNQLRKEHYLRALSNCLGLDEEVLDSFKNSKVDSLDAVTKAFGITDVMGSAAKGYTISKVELVQRFMAYHGVDFDDLGEALSEQVA
ncbi:A2 protein [Vibrio phage JSF12]|uniref:A2 protein n=2 Tax=Jesfedecavirus TaxID=2560156 RepID=A0A2D0Z6E3_9CAUD|nr:DNA binding protein [Vibrio phage JSF10]YP_009794779.1 DNA binding protein [Vibrio phage JSF12]ASV43485.1 A2 protein [Vibrio phage JSF10]ASV43614.1 A2 protein [Vibrio phage JSF12]